VICCTISTLQIFRVSLKATLLSHSSVQRLLLTFCMYVIWSRGQAWIWLPQA
jgi:hypothetical protein